MLLLLLLLLRLRLLLLLLLPLLLLLLLCCCRCCCCCEGYWDMPLASASEWNLKGHIAAAAAFADAATVVPQ